MRLLVTGAGGFIGSHVCEEAVRRGHQVRALAHYRGDGTAGWLDHIPDDVTGEIDLRLGDIRDAGQVRTVMQGCDGVLHLAALIGIPYSYEAPESYIQTNVQGTFNILEAARSTECERVVVTSTSEVYGTAQAVPITESHPISPQSPYAASKVSADALALAYHRSFGLPVTTLRPFNNFGPRQSQRAIIPTIIHQLMSSGGEVHLGKTGATRDFVYVSDTADAFMRMLTANEVVGQVVQVSSGYEISVGDLALLIGTLMGLEVSIRVDTRRLRPPGSEVERLIGASDRAARVLGWQPQRSGEDRLARGLESTIEWIRRRGSTSTQNVHSYHR